MDPNLYTDEESYRETRRANRAKLWLIVALTAVLILILIIAGTQTYRASRFYVVSTSQPQNITTLSTEFNIKFNRPISKNGLSVSVIPEAGSYKGENDISGDTLGVQLSTPLKSQQYTITINKVMSTNGRTLTNLSYSFTPKSANKSQMSEGDQENLIKRNQESPDYKDPILDHIPYSTLDYSITPYFKADSNDISHLILQIQLLVPPGQNTASYSSQDKQEALQYIKSLGLDPAKYTIQYTVVNETLTGV